MKLRSFAVVAVVLFVTAVTAHAQVGLYLNPLATRVSNPVVDNSVFSFMGPGTTSRTFWGLDLGGYYDFPHTGKYAAGVDLRGHIQHADNAALKELLVGVRFSGTPFQRPWRPYVEASIGPGYTKAPHSDINLRKVDYRIFAGVDYPIHKHVDWRVFEFGYGTLRTISNYTVGTGSSTVIPASTLLNFSTGLVFRF